MTMSPNDYEQYVSKEQRRRRIKLIVVEILVSVLLIILAIIFSSFLKNIIPKKIVNAVNLKPDSDSFKVWCKPPVTMTRAYYLFNITNPIEIVTNPTSTTVHVKNTPSYTYNMETNKINIQWSNDNKHIRYAIERLFTRHPIQFNPSSANDTGVFLDLVRAIFRTQFQAKAAQSFYELSGMETFPHRNAVEQLEGFTSDLFKSFQDKMIGPNRAKSGFIYRYNGSGLFNYSIQADPEKKGQILTFASELVPFEISSPSDYEFPIYDGLTFPSMLFDKPTFNIFQGDICYPILLEHNQIVTKFGGLKMYKYKIKLVDFNNCTNPNDTRTCPEVEKIDISQCISASLPDNTIFLSKAHFYGSSNETIEQMNIQGFKPTTDEHDSAIYFEPYSGVPFEGVFRIQLNIDAIIDPMKTSNFESEQLTPADRKGIKRMIPLVWIDQKTFISKKVIKKLRTPLLFLYYGEYFSIGLAIGLSIGFILYMEFIAKRAHKNNDIHVPIM
ncbi:unnamed protein product [Rotaria sordida]|uniref:Uncharacterized protein n=1 Tax=Rotaria sordida TaxID=392033 RepID=A0A815SJM5_9BILA|nr:unnamed protein product [Rotaria sordida]CAF1491569.1 unnamed protein product [Rotaria sordida]